MDENVKCKTQNAKIIKAGLFFLFFCILPLEFCISWCLGVLVVSPLWAPEGTLFAKYTLAAALAQVYNNVMSTLREKPLTDRGRDLPSVRQVSVFTENRVGALVELLGVFDHTGVHILALTVIQCFDCAIVRFVFSDTDKAAKLLADKDLRFTICDLVAVGMDTIDGGLTKVSKALLSAEIDIHYCYALLTGKGLRGAVVIHVDDPALATIVLTEHSFPLLDENDLRE